MATSNVKKYCMEMEILEISKLESTRSPELLIFGIPWYVIVSKSGQVEEKSIGIYLHCANKDKSPNWSLWGKASFKLMPVDEATNAKEHRTDPFVFDNSGFGIGAGSLIKWRDLFDGKEKYVKNDKINVAIEISAEDPNDPNRSCLNFECLYKCCDNSNYSRFQIKVNNVSNLMAVKSPKFSLHSLPWEISVSKSRSSHLGATLRLKGDYEKEGQMTMSIKLVSRKKDVHPIDKTVTKQCQYFRNIHVEEIVSWDEMVKLESGFVNKKSITLEIEIYSEKPKGDVTSKSKTDAKSPQMECAICLDDIGSENLACTPCGHMFCLDCITKVVNDRAACPACNKAVQLDALRRLYLPVIN